LLIAHFDRVATREVDTEIHATNQDRQQRDHNQRTGQDHCLALATNEIYRGIFDQVSHDVIQS